MKNYLSLTSSKLALFLSIFFLSGCGKVVSDFKNSTIKGATLEFDALSTIDLNNISAYTISGRCVTQAGDVEVNVGSPTAVTQTLACVNDRFTGVFDLSSSGLPPGNIQLFANQTIITIASTSYAFLNLGATIVTPADGSSVNNISQTVTGACLTGASLTFSGDIVGSPNTTCSGSTYSRAITLSAGEGPKTITVTQDDLGGHTNVTHSNITYDITPPTFTLTTTARATTGANPIVFTATFNEPVTGLTAGDVTLTNASVASITGGPAVYTINITPAAQGDLTVSIGANTVEDLAGNENLTGSGTFSSLYIPGLTSNTFVSRWTIPANNTDVTLPLFNDSPNYNFTVDWGDGTPLRTVTTWDDVDKNHTYASAGNYIVIIRGTLNNWGYQTWTVDQPCYITEVSRFGRMGWNRLVNGFRNCTNLVTFISEGTSDLSFLYNVSQMFMDAVNLENINTGSWNTSFFINTSSMFRNAVKVNPEVRNWNMSKIVEMKNMFEGATSANPDVSLWDTSKVLTISGMFKDATSANPDVSQWNTSSMDRMAQVFNGATSANPDVSQWDTSKVYTFNEMFRGATNANPNMSNWDFSSMTTATDFLADSGIDNTNYSNFLIRANTNGPNNMSIGDIPAQYQPGAGPARANLLGPKGWTFTDDGAE